jgi:hypothetical protein
VGAALMAPQGLAILIGCLGRVAVVFVNVRCQRAVRIFAASRICADHGSPSAALDLVGDGVAVIGVAFLVLEAAALSAALTVVALSRHRCRIFVMDAARSPFNQAESRFWELAASGLFILHCSN